ncbi:MAG TPA: ATPase domain-containing protein [Streptosporangiaceae bacterium]
MTARLGSGVARLDSVLDGGLPRDAITLVIGLPGSGKTILAQQCAFANGTAERPALYLSTVSEPLEKILRYGQTLAFFDAGAVGTRVVYEDLGGVLGDKGLGGLLTLVRDLLRTHRPGVIVVDSFKALYPYARGSGEFRRFLHDLAGMLSAYPVTSLWVGEYGEDEVAVAPEFAVADAIIALGTSRTAERESRGLRVLKLRGGGYRSGRHAYRISAGGIAVFPRLADPGADRAAGSDGPGLDTGDRGLDGDRVSTGIGALDDLLADGYRPGAATLVAGPTGVGKTIMGLHFVFGGAARGEPGVVAAFQEYPSRLERTARAFGWSFADAGVTLLHRGPIDLYLDEWVHDLLETAEATGARRVLVDGLGDLRDASLDAVRFRECTYSLVHRLSRRGVGLMMTYEVPELFGLSRLPEHDASQVSDNVVLLGYQNTNGTIARTITVLKTRAGHHDPRVQEFQITAGGVRLTQCGEGWPPGRG